MWLQAVRSKTVLAQVFVWGGSMSMSARLKRPGILAATLVAFLAVMFGGAQAASSSPGHTQLQR
jgi:hypothetical protein